jgi:hypothetical protein
MAILEEETRRIATTEIKVTDAFFFILPSSVSWFVNHRFGKRNCANIVEAMIPQIYLLSILKRGCENYLFAYCRLKPGIAVRTATLKRKQYCTMDPLFA